jgi:hypothetical protein
MIDENRRRMAVIGLTTCIVAIYLVCCTSPTSKGLPDSETQRTALESRLQSEILRNERAEKQRVELQNQLDEVQIQRRLEETQKRNESKRQQKIEALRQHEDAERLQEVARLLQNDERQIAELQINLLAAKDQIVKLQVQLDFEKQELERQMVEARRREMELVEARREMELLKAPPSVQPTQPKARASEEMPHFPWPPPAASASEVIPNALLNRRRAVSSFSDVDALLSRALDHNGYVEKSYYPVPHGFALVTRFEQIDKNGKSKKPPDRWSVGRPPQFEFTLLSYLTALLTAKSGFYRVIVFVVTSEPFSQRENRVTSDEAVRWLREGFNVLPVSVGVQPYTQDVQCTALIYEFQTSSGTGPGLVQPSHLGAATHLQQSGLWGAL